MHLWPSTRIRDSFKLAYLKRVDLNLYRMKNEKRASSASQKLLQGQTGNEQNGTADTVQDAASTSQKSPLDSCCECLLLILLCCSCFCCGLCSRKDDDDR